MIILNEDATRQIVWGFQTKREITIEQFQDLGKLVVPKGSRVIVKDDVSKTGGTWVLADVFIQIDAVFYGVRIEADDLEPIGTLDHGSQ